MRRICTTVMASTALALALPGAASAHHRARHHRAHHSRTITFQAHKTTTTTATPGAPTTTHTEPAPGSGEAAGVVTAFENNVLTITLADKSVVSGKVVEGATQVLCPGASSGEAGDDSDDTQSGEQAGGDNSQGAGGSGGGDSGGFAGGHGDEMSGGPSGGPGWSGGDDGNDGSDSEGETASCGTSALKAGAKVAEAELRISSAGAVWEKVVLAQ